jgi:hypothetical protein
MHLWENAIHDDYNDIVGCYNDMLCSVNVTRITKRMPQSHNEYYVRCHENNGEYAG